MYALDSPGENPILGVMLFSPDADPHIFTRDRRAALNTVEPGRNTPSPRRIYGPDRDSTYVRPRSRSRR